ncbi:MAG: metal ABC transporter ATP-binding protein [Patescibacteria group bacterium]
MSSIIETKNLSVSYGQTEALSDVSFAIEQGDFVGLAGPNGAGKTTLIKTILGLLPSSSGQIKLFGKSESSFNEWGKIGYLPQKISTINVLFPATSEEVVTLGLLSQKKFPKRILAGDMKKVDDILKELGISNLKKKMLSELSGGQQQKVLLARALVSDPEILIFDEPSTALDPESRESFFKLIQKLNKQKGITVVLITHDTGYIGQYANKLLYIDKSLIYFGKFSDFCASKKMNSYFGKYEQHIICHQHN